ncbi:MAG: hypothetical protein PHU85_14120, partial [Phycisphaerae bacterium]|nr:hypothetical protein [Phycisphaerae bacterium]
MRETVAFFTDAGQVLATAGALDGLRNLAFNTALPGGFTECTCEVPLSFTRGWNVKEGQKIAVYDGLAQVYVGRLEALGRSVDLSGPLHKGWRKVTAYGYYSNLSQRTYTANYASGSPYASDIIRHMLATYCPLVSGDYSQIESPGVPLAPIEWTSAYCNTVIDDLLGYGDSQTPP